MHPYFGQVFFHNKTVDNIKTSKAIKVRKNIVLRFNLKIFINYVKLNINSSLTTDFTQMVFYKKHKIIILIFIFLFFALVSITKLNLYKSTISTLTQKIECQDCNIIFVSFDTLRAANVGFMGYKRDITPTLDKLAKQGFIFTNDISTASWTLPSTMSWFTGVYPSNHKVVNKYTVLKSGEEEITNLKKLSPNIKTLAEILKENGYRTGGFTGGAGVDREFGFNQGFEVYADDKVFAGLEESVPKALNWIKQHKNEKLFVFLHGYNIHGQYVPQGGFDHRFVDFTYKGKLTGSKEEQLELREQGVASGKIFLTQEDVRFLTALYDEKVQRADFEFSRFLNEYEKLGLMNKTVFIITSDHGEEFYEHGRIDHGMTLYDEVIHVPLLIKIPGITQKIKINFQVRNIDLMPTILDLIKVPIEENIKEQMRGVSLVPYMTGKINQNLDAFSETDYRYAVSLRSLRDTNNWKTILNLETNSSELYNLNIDPYEKNDLSQSQSNKLYDINQKLREYIYVN